MAFSLTLADPEGETFPLPTSPVVAQARTRGLAFRIVMITALWAVQGVLTVGVTAGLLIGEPFVDLPDSGPLVPTMTYLFLPCVALASMITTGNAQKQIYGYSEHSLNVKYRSSNAPAHGRPMNRCAAAIGFCAGGVVALVLLPWAAFAGAAWWRQALVLLVLAVLGACAVVTLRIELPQVGTARLWLSESQHRLQDVVDHGAHTVATVARVEHTGSWLDALPIFVLTLFWSTGQGTREATIRITDYPCWAPVEGNEFDVWFDPAAPDDDTRVFLHRRLVGQRFAENPERFRAPGEGDSGPGPIEPPYASARTGSPVERWLCTFIAVACAAIGVAGVAATPMAFGDLPWWSKLCILVQALFLIANAALWVTFACRHPWFARHGHSASWITWLPFLGLFGITLPVLGTDPVWGFDYDRDIETLTLWLYLAMIVAGVVTYLLSFVLIMAGHRMLNAGVVVPPEEVAEALRHHDRAAIDQLRIRYGYLAGVIQSS
ncbi:hypothetical protein GCM10027290_56470 [Micromonospora sonneratiae]|uniref:Uncharacterized protein n=1 Tax=Micromonospora sonneratiae TaxID=1184706 RepID=A0ABW3YE79_9ACTN